MRISDWSSDVCASDLSPTVVMAVAPSFIAARRHFPAHLRPHGSPEESSVMEAGAALVEALVDAGVDTAFTVPGESFLPVLEALRHRRNRIRLVSVRHEAGGTFAAHGRSEEHTSELQSLMRISYAVFCLKKKKHDNHIMH